MIHKCDSGASLLRKLRRRYLSGPTMVVPLNTEVAGKESETAKSPKHGRPAQDTAS